MHPPTHHPPACRLGVREEAGHDAVLLMDRVMSTSLQLAPDLLDLLAVGCVVICAKQVGAGRCCWGGLLVPGFYCCHQKRLPSALALTKQVLRPALRTGGWPRPQRWRAARAATWRRCGGGQRPAACCGGPDGMERSAGAGAGATQGGEGRVRRVASTFSSKQPVISTTCAALALPSPVTGPPACCPARPSLIRPTAAPASLF